MKILLVGNPNVGKSAIFTQLTGVSVTTSNYPGTTVSYFQGTMTYEDQKIEVIDVPGTYHLKPENEAEKVAVDMITTGDILINVVDATNLERNLNLTLQLMEYNKPMVIALNLWDEAIHKGIGIGVDKLEDMLKIPVIPTNGITGEGLRKLQSECMNAKPSLGPRYDSKQRWDRIGEIICNVQNLTHRRHTFMEKIQDLIIHPLWGLPLSLISLFVVFRVIITLGEMLVGIMEKLFAFIYSPFIFWLNHILQGNEFIRYLFIGQIDNGPIDYEGAMGVLTTGVFTAFGLVLPYILVFYLVMGFLEDLGYLPRVAIMFDRTLHRIGLHGFSVIPMLLACGCNVPGVMAIRNLESRKEKFITAIITCITIPCMAQTALILRAVGSRGGIYVALVFMTLLMVWVGLGVILKISVQGSTPTLLMEVPPYRLPGFKIQMKKLKMRLSCYFKEAIPYVLGGILIINFLDAIGIIQALGHFFSPLIKGVFGLPEETVSTLIIGVMRKDAAVALLEPMRLSDSQIVIAVMVLILYFPCVATFTVLLKELGFMDTAKGVGIMFVTTLVLGGFLNLLFGIGLSPIGVIFLELLIIALFIVIDTNLAKCSEHSIDHATTL
jgi:ferrous iron transport protein B